MVYTCSLDGIVRLWDARTGRLLTDYRGHTAEILDFALSKYESGKGWSLFEYLEDGKGPWGAAGSLGVWEGLLKRQKVGPKACWQPVSPKCREA